VSLLRDCSSTENSGMPHHEDCQESLFFIIFLTVLQICSFPFSWHFNSSPVGVLSFEMFQYALFLILSTSTHFFYDPAKVIIPSIL